MLEFAIETRRGHFCLQIECLLASEWTVVFGSSGAGKSTLLRMLAGLDRPNHGRIALDGNVLTDAERDVHVGPSQRHIGLVTQQPALFPHLTVAANVGYGLASLDSSIQQSRIQEMLKLVDAEALADRRPRDLSGGEAQRVALARALAPLPRLLLLDEPFSALDGRASDSLLAKLGLWVREHEIQTILVTHDATDAFAIRAEVVLLREGRLEAHGPAAQVLALERERIIARL